MFRSPNRTLLFVVLACVLTISCSTPKTRIKRDFSNFGTYPPETQMKIQNGEVEVGFTEQMVFLARGEPDERSTWRRGGGTHPLWKYKLRSYSAANPGSGDPGFSGSYQFPNFGPRAAVQAIRRYFVVAFQDGKVVSVRETK